MSDCILNKKPCRHSSASRFSATFCLQRFCSLALETPKEAILRIIFTHPRDRRYASHYGYQEVAKGTEIGKIVKKWFWSCSCQEVSGSPSLKQNNH